MQPLHVYEPRYRQLVEQAIAGDHLIGMVLLRAGWEHDYDGRPPIEPVACLARITNCRPLADGRYNMLVRGLRRIELVRELPPLRLFREAECRLVEESYCGSATAGSVLRRDLIEACRKFLPAFGGSQDQLEELLTSDLPLGVLTDIIGYTLELDLHEKQALLAESIVERRAQRILAHLSSLPVPCHRPGFPPGFSPN
jgi:Lon protease-like protein